ncbi:unnamed protein product [Camellia sinensis]
MSDEPLEELRSTSCEADRRAEELRSTSDEAETETKTKQNRWLKIDPADDPTRYVLNPNPRGEALIP